VKILKFSAENVKGIKVVEITPAGDVVTISGKNGAGKSSILDAIEATLCGGALPLGKGADRGEVTIDLGDYTVNRVITEKTDRLIVKNKDGANYPSPREFLSKFIGPLSIDPLAFIKLKEKEQLDILFKLAPGLKEGLEAADKKIADLKAQRSDIRKDGERAKMDLERATHYPDMPENEVSVADLTEQLNDAMRINKLCEDHVRKITESQQLIKIFTTRQTVLEQAITDAEKALEKAKRDLAANIAGMQEHNETLKTLVKDQPSTVPIQPITEKIASSENMNKKIRGNKAKLALQARRDALAADYTFKGKEVSDAEEDRAAILKGSEFPVPNLSVDNGVITAGGIPIWQLCTAEKVRIGASIAVSQNPKAKIILADDVSLLDSDNLKILMDICKAGDFQIWMVKNDESKSQGFYIEQGVFTETKPETVPQASQSKAGRPFGTAKQI
jgi:hypothetical protein